MFLEMMNWQVRGLSCKPNIYMSWSTSDLRMRFAPRHQFNPSGKIILPTVPRRYFFCGSFMLFLVCVCYAFMRVCLLLPCGHLLRKGWPLGSRIWFPIVSLLLSHRYPGSGVVLDCIDSWSLPPFVLLIFFLEQPQLEICDPFVLLCQQSFYTDQSVCIDLFYHIEESQCKDCKYPLKCYMMWYFISLALFDEIKIIFEKKYNSFGNNILLK